MPTDIAPSLPLAACTVMLAVAAWRDAKVHRIPNWVVLPGAVVALVLSALPGGIGFGTAMYGMAAGLVVLLPFYLMRVMGAGDVKLLAAVGAFVGFPGVLGVALIAFLAGGVLSLVWAMRHRQLRAVFDNLRTGLVMSASRVVAWQSPRAAELPLSGVRVPYAFAIAIGAAGYFAS